MPTKSTLIRVLVAMIAITSIISSAWAQEGIRLRKGDQFELRISGVPGTEVAAVSNTYRIADDGTINLHLINQLKVDGLTVAEIQRLIENTYRNSQIYTNPTITINVQTGERFVTVGGDVRSPGRVPYTNDLTILTAINASGGFTEFADPKKVRLLRGDKSYEVDIRKIRSQPSEDIRMLPGDKVEVPRSFF